VNEHNTSVVSLVQNARKKAFCKNFQHEQTYFANFSFQFFLSLPSFLTKTCKLLKSSTLRSNPWKKAAVLDLGWNVWILASLNPWNVLNHESSSSSSSTTVIRSVASGKQTENNRFKFRRGGDVFWCGGRRRNVIQTWFLCVWVL